MFEAIKCWICNSDMNYLYDKEMEELNWHRFDCSKCDESVLCPQNAPYLNIKHNI